MTAHLHLTAHFHRQHAHVVSFKSDTNGHVRAFSVKCPYCRGIHQHTASRATDYAQAWCGTPAGAYDVVWPEPAVDNPPLTAEADIRLADAGLVQDGIPTVSQAVQS